MINSNVPNFEIEKKVQNKFLLTLQLSSSEQSMQSQSPLQRWDIKRTSPLKQLKPPMAAFMLSLIS